MIPSAVPAGPLLVDTDVFSFIAWDRGRYLEFGALVVGHVLAVSFATVGELRAGAIQAKWGPKRVATLDGLLRQYVVISATDEVTRQFAEVKAKLHDRLKSGGVNDMWTAAAALAQPTPPPIVTANLSDFLKISAAFPKIRLIHPDL